ncbi:MAG TPA: spore germination protein [Symbiobacteriaceae bacterium]
MGETGSKIDLEAAVSTLKDRLQAGDELTVRRFTVTFRGGERPLGPQQRSAVVLYLRSLVNSEQVDRFMLLPLLAGEVPGQGNLEEAIADRLPASSLKRTASLDSTVQAMLAGEAVLLIDDAETIFHIAAQQVAKRSPDEPEAERIIRGPKEGFIEELDANVGLIRRRLRTETLRVTRLQIGRRSPTHVALFYLDGVANPQVIDTVRQRLGAVDLDTVPNSSLLQALIQDSPWTLFPLMRISERPDTVTRELSNGRIVILADGSPSALLVPATFWDLLKTEVDYAYGPWVATFYRLVRFLGLLIGGTLPGLYIALVSFHPELIPNRLSLTIAASREGMPLATLTEMGGMLLVFEIFREATLRTPPAIGQAVGVVAGFILGQAAVAAGIISDIMVVVVALSAISLKVVPDFEMVMVVRIISFGGLISSALFGLFGLGLWGIVLGTHLVSLKSFGVPFLSPLAPSQSGGWLDVVIRAPLFLLRKRPAHLGPQDPTRLGSYDQPEPHRIRPGAEGRNTAKQPDGKKGG